LRRTKIWFYQGPAFRTCEARKVEKKKLKGVAGPTGAKGMEPKEIVGVVEVERKTGLRGVEYTSSLLKTAPWAEVQRSLGGDTLKDSGPLPGLPRNEATDAGENLLITTTNI